MPKVNPHPRIVAMLAPVDGRRTRYTFTGIRGLQLDCIPDGTPLGKRVWRVRYYVGDVERTVTLGTFNENDREGYLSLSFATEKAAEHRRAVKMNGRDPRDVGDTFADLFSRWLEQHAMPQKKSWRADANLFERHLRNRLGLIRVAELTRRHIIEALDNIAGDASGIQANRCQSLVTATLNWALSEDLIVASPAAGIRKRAKETARERVLSDNEIRRWWRALDDHASPRVGAVLRLLLLTGLRLSEVCGMRRDELQGDVFEIPGERTKSGLPHSAPLTPRSLAILNGIIDESSPFLLPAVSRGKLLDKPMSRHTPDHAYAELAEKLGMVDDDGKPDTGVHDLRRTAATNLAKLGVGEDLIDRIQGRVRCGSVGWVYNRHAYLTEKRDALARWEAYLLGIVS
jgi:integrase